MTQQKKSPKFYLIDFLVFTSIFFSIYFGIQEVFKIKLDPISLTVGWISFQFATEVSSRVAQRITAKDS